jgi:hypothetical protein
MANKNPPAGRKKTPFLWSICRRGLIKSRLFPFGMTISIAQYCSAPKGPGLRSIKGICMATILMVEDELDVQKVVAKPLTSRGFTLRIRWLPGGAKGVQDHPCIVKYLLKSSFSVLKTRFLWLKKWNKTLDKKGTSGDNDKLN